MKAMGQVGLFRVTLFCPSLGFCKSCEGHGKGRAFQEVVGLMDACTDTLYEAHYHMLSCSPTLLSALTVLWASYIGF